MPPEANGCEHGAIPARLHRDGRPAEQDFDNGEPLYRRCYPQKGPLIGKEGTVNDAHFSTKEMSLNRRRFSEQPEDVLWNTTTGAYDAECGIVAFPCDEVLERRLAHPTTEGLSYVLRLVHKPEPCMQPHTIIEVTEEKRNENGELIEANVLEEEIRPGSVKRGVRKFYAARSQVVREYPAEN